MTTGSGLPDFLHPPVDEVALSIQFPPIPGFNLQHFGAYWQGIRADFPRFEVQQPIPNVTETFGPNPLRHQLKLALLPLPEIRAWYIAQTGTNLIQIQRDRFVYNWRKVTGAEMYPRYPAIREALEREWRRFCGFLKDEGLQRPKVDQCEVVYVNNIEYGRGWNGYGELDKVIATLATPRSNARFLPNPEQVSMQVVYRLEEDAGRLYVQFNPVIRGRDGKEVLQMSLTARGAPKFAEDRDVFAWLDLGRKWVVRGFADFTAQGMHQVWGKQE
jgi:uncharacterized protein (TIGR04255 family)